MLRKLFTIFFGGALVASLSMCKSSGENTDYFDCVELADTLTHHAEYLTIADLGDGDVRVDIVDPWNNDSYLAHYALVHRDSVLPEGLTSDVRVIRTPIDRAAVYSSVHTGGLEELGALDVLVAVADGQYFGKNDTVATLLHQGKVTDIGPSQGPSAERLAASRSQIVLRSPMQGITSPTLPSGIVPIECADYLETSPIGRAEWILLLGELTGRRAEAQAIFTDVIDTYSDLVFKASSAKSKRPKVLTETEQSGVWYLPAGKSFMARMLADAGAEYPWADTDGVGSLALSIEKVAEKAIDADVWLVRSYGFTPTAKSLVAANPRYASFKPVKEGAIYGCDTSIRPIFNDVAFHPERVLADYVAIFHPDVMPNYELRYFSR